MGREDGRWCGAGRRRFGKLTRTRAAHCARPVLAPQVPRPDGKTDNLGLAVLDEPASTQSDPTVLTLQLRAVSKASGTQPMLVRSVEHAEKDPKAITGWIASIADLHRHKPAPSVRYSRPMPDIEQLMQIWPAPIEELLEQNPLPDADISLDLPSYVRMVTRHRLPTSRPTVPCRLPPSSSSLSSLSPLFSSSFPLSQPALASSPCLTPLATRRSPPPGVCDARHPRARQADRGVARPFHPLLRLQGQCPLPAADLCRAAVGRVWQRWRRRRRRFPRPGGGHGQPVRNLLSTAPPEHRSS